MASKIAKKVGHLKILHIVDLLRRICDINLPMTMAMAMAMTMVNAKAKAKTSPYIVPTINGDIL